MRSLTPTSWRRAGRGSILVLLVAASSAHAGNYVLVDESGDVVESFRVVANVMRADSGATIGSAGTSPPYIELPTDYIEVPVTFPIDRTGRLPNWDGTTAYEVMTRAEYERERVNRMILWGLGMLVGVLLFRVWFRSVDQRQLTLTKPG